MNKINKNLILVPLILVFVLGFSIASPVQARTLHVREVTVQSGATFTPDPYQEPIAPIDNDEDNIDTDISTNGSSTAGLNPVPTISQISPSKAPANTEVITITVTGSRFMVGSIGRVNDENRTTNYVYEKINGVNHFKSTVLTMVLTKEDLSPGKPLTITVFNPAPGGGTSNAITFNDNEKNSSLAAGAIFGSDGFMPRTFIQWFMLLILVLLLVILVRKAYRKKEKYQETPLKHA